MNTSETQKDYILLDVGGTFVKCSDGREIPINSNGSREEIVASFKDAVADYKCVRAAVPGPFNYETGHFLMKHKFAAVYDEYFQDIVGVSDCKFIHDVNCMLLGEVKRGNAAKYNRVAVIALGTGLGFAISVDGELVKNENGSPAVSLYNRPYRDGVLEDYASKRGVWKLYGDDSIPVKDIAMKAFAGDAKAQEAFKTMGEILAEEIAPIMKEYGIECLLLGGQISRSWQLFAPYIKEGLAARGMQLEISPISDFDNATFNGLACLL